MIRSRVTVAEKLRVKANAAKANMDESEYVRRAALNTKITVQNASVAMPDFITRNELRRIGVNLNQIARVLNAGQKTPPPELNDILQTLDRLFDRWLEYDTTHRKNGTEL